ncbi:MAG: TonB C-terminal domain-containing protein, partial [Persicimonas sp.]
GPEPEPEPEKEEKKEEPKPPQPDRKKKMLDSLDDLNNPNRPTNTDTPEGDPDGVAGGTVSDKALANMMNTYQAQLMKSVTKYWRLPKSLSDGEIEELTGKVVVYVRLSEEGHIIDYKFRQKSPNPQFNGSIERVLKRFQVSRGGRTLPMPDDTQVRREVRRQGLNLRNWDPDG